MQNLFKADQVEKTRDITKIISGQFLTFPAPWRRPSFWAREEATFDLQSDWGGGAQLSLYPPTLRSLQGNPKCLRDGAGLWGAHFSSPRAEHLWILLWAEWLPPQRTTESWPLVPECMTLSGGAQSLSRVQLLVTLSRARIFTEVITSKQGHWGEH